MNKFRQVAFVAFTASVLTACDMSSSEWSALNARMDGMADNLLYQDPAPYISVPSGNDCIPYGNAVC